MAPASPGHGLQLGSRDNVFICLGAFSTLKIPMVTFEIAVLGRRFSTVRSAITIPAFIGLALLMERLLPPIVDSCSYRLGSDLAPASKVGYGHSGVSETAKGAAGVGLSNGLG